MKSIYYLILIAVLLAACTPSASQVQEVISQTQAMWTSVPTNSPFPTLTPFPTYTAFPTYTLQPTIAVEVTRIVMVTATNTPTPLYTPTEPGPPTETPNATKTAEALQYAKLHSNKEDGNYLVNVDIAPGIWRSQGTGPDCYWEIDTRNGGIINNYIGNAGGTAYIDASAFSIMFERCGTWVFLSPP
jgi:hypothetical protein